MLIEQLFPVVLGDALLADLSLPFPQRPPRLACLFPRLHFVIWDMLRDVHEMSFR